jgi:predicted glutamine amidotransferase
MRKVTISQVSDWGPCSRHTRERIVELFYERRYITALDIISLDINIEQKIWFVLHNGFFSDSDLRRLASVFEERVLSIEDVRVSRLHKLGESIDDELVSAWISARDAYDATKHDAKNAAWVSSVDAAMSVAWAAGYHAWCAEYEAQIETIKLYLGGQSEKSNG